MGVRWSISLDDATADAVRSLADEAGISVSAWIKRAVDINVTAERLAPAIADALAKIEKARA